MLLTSEDSNQSAASKQDKGQSERRLQTLASDEESDTEANKENEKGNDNSGDITIKRDPKLPRKCIKNVERL